MKIGAIDYLNCLPPYYAYYAPRTEVFPLPGELVAATPAELNRRLAAGELDVSVISSFAFASRWQDYVLLDDYCLSSTGYVKSVLLASRVPLAELDRKRIGLTSASATAAALLKIYLGRFLGYQNEFATLDVRPLLSSREVPTDAPEALLVIGDDALRFDPAASPFRHVYDLGDLWTSRTCRPVVFGVWAARRSFAESEPAALARFRYWLKASYQEAMDHPEELASVAARRFPSPGFDHRAYFPYLRYPFVPATREALDFFCGEAFAAGLLPDRPRIIAAPNAVPSPPATLDRAGRASSPSDILAGLARGKRLRAPEAEILFSADPLLLGRAADQRRREMLGHDRVGYLVDRNITFTNVCVNRCRFCAFYRDPGATDAFRLSTARILEKTGELVSLGGTQVMLQGGVHPDNGLDFYCRLLAAIKARYPGVYLHSLSAEEVRSLARREKMSLDAVLRELKTAGLDSLPGAAEILVDRVRHLVSPGKLDTGEWLDVMRAVAAAGMRATATMTFGLGETLAERIEHLERVRSLQDETGGVFRAFIPWPFSPARTRLSHLPPQSGIDYLKVVAISRLYLDNVFHITAGWVTEGIPLAEIALHFGADDMGGTLMEEVVVKATGLAHQATPQALARAVLGAGRLPRRRDSRYDTVPPAAGP